MTYLKLAPLAVAGLLLAACSGGGSSTTPSVGGLTTSPASSQTSPIVLSLTGGSGGTPQTTALTFTQSGLSAQVTFNVSSSTCFGKTPAPTDLISLSAGTPPPTFANGTQTVTLDITAQNAGTCSFTTTSPAGNRSVTTYFKVTP